MNRYNIYSRGNSGDIRIQSILMKISIVHGDKREDVYVDPVSLITESEFWRVILIGSEEIPAPREITCDDDLDAVKYVLDIVHDKEIKELDDVNFLLSVHSKLSEWDMEKLDIKFMRKQGAGIHSPYTMPTEDNYKQWVINTFMHTRWFKMMPCEDMRIAASLCNESKDIKFSVPELISARQFIGGCHERLERILDKEIRARDLTYGKCKYTITRGPNRGTPCDAKALHPDSQGNCNTRCSSHKDK